MERPADPRLPIHELLQRRWSPRGFTDRAVASATLRLLFEAARLAPSSFNEQPWHFLVADKREPAAFARMLGCLSANNQRWAQTAPVLLISVATLAFRHNGKPNRHALHDVGLATACLIVQAMALGLHVHPMAGFDRDKARAVYGIPAEAEAVAAIAVGHAGDSPLLPDDLRERDRAVSPRRSVADIAFGDHWGQVPDWARD